VHVLNETPSTTLPVLPSVTAVIENLRWVSFKPQAIPSAVLKWGHEVNPHAAWHHPCHPKGEGQEGVQWIFVLDVLNHCFWPDPNHEAWGVEYRGRFYSGYWGLAACLRRAVDEGVPICDAGFLRKMDRESIQHLFRGRGSIPLMEERLNNLREAGEVLLHRWGGHIIHLLEESGQDAVRTVHQIVESFPSFRDESSYNGKKVYFWKRAQLFVSDVHQSFSGRDWGAFERLDKLTAFADYKLPQVLRELKIISYEKGLEERVDNLSFIDAGSPEENEIRAATVWAVEQLKSEFHRQGRKVDSPWVDNWLWNLGQRSEFRKRPYHRCRTIYY